MELKHSCKICNRKFANGKSMGGHMRSHFAKLPIQSRSSASRQSESLNARAPVTCLSRSCDPLGQSLDYGCGYQAKNASSANWISAMPALRVRASSRKRSKRIPRFIKKESKPSSAPPLDPRYGEFTSPETLVLVEDAARCLMKLSKDKWPENDERLHNNDFPYFVETHSENDTLSDEEEDDEEEEDLSEPVEEIFGRRCQMCKKVFKNYQALGGHMRNHRRPVAGPVPVVEKRVFQCEICLKVFGSGQALGGHKKVHLFMEKKTVIENDLPIFENDPDSDCEFKSESISASETSSDT